MAEDKNTPKPSDVTGEPGCAPTDVANQAQVPKERALFRALLVTPTISATWQQVRCPRCCPSRVTPHSKKSAALAFTRSHTGLTR